MRIVIAPDSFKGSLTSVEAAAVMTRACRKVFPEAEVVEVPLADGGAGLLEAVRGLVPGVMRKHRVSNPLDRPILAEWLQAGRRAYIETARACGLTLIPEKRRDARETTSYGAGQLIAAALEAGCRQLFVGLGGSATNDGGMGALSALGVRFLARDGSRILSGAGKDLGRVASIDASGLPSILSHCSILLLSDVTNPLCGRHGASAVYGPQKGAAPATVRELDVGMRRYGRVVERSVRRRIAGIPGAGAAGGLGAGFLAFLPCRIVSGVETMLDLAGFDAKLAGAGLLLTGEGRIDRQTAFGKTLGVLFDRAAARKVPVIAFGGSVEKEAERAVAGRDVRLIAATPPDVPLAKAMRHAAGYLSHAVEEALRNGKR